MSQKRSMSSAARKRARFTEAVGFDRSRGGLQANSRSAFLAKLRATTKESGYFDVATAGYGLDTTGTIAQLNAVTQGAANTQRIGKKIIMKSLQCRGGMSGNTTSTVNDVAYMIVYDRRPTGVLPNITDILDTVSSYAMNNDDNSGRFKILKRVDEVLIGTPSTTATYTEALYKGTDWFLDLKGLPVTYKSAGTGAMGDVEEGALYIVSVGNQPAGAGAASIAAAFRLRFVDV